MVHRLHMVISEQPNSGLFHRSTQYNLFREGPAMAIGDVRATGIAKATVPNYTAPQPESSFFPQLQASTGIPGDATSTVAQLPTLQARSVVEQRFRRMNAAHDRIRTEVLCAHDPAAE